MNVSKESITRTLQRLDAMTDKDINYSEIPPLTPEMFAKAIVCKGLKPVTRKAQITLRVDAEVLEWFKRQGKGYQTQINAILKAYKEAHENV
jgi:uncharacterized protein (DUF4415 family)